MGGSRILNSWSNTYAACSEGSIKEIIDSPELHSPFSPEQVIRVASIKTREQFVTRARPLQFYLSSWLATHLAFPYVSEVKKTPEVFDAEK